MNIDTNRPDRHRRLLLLAAPAALAACSSITPPRMVPEEASRPGRRVALRVRIGTVTGARETFFGGAPFPNDAQMREALVAAMRKAAVFSVADDGADADLVMSVLSQDQTGLLPTTARLVANYRLVGRGGATIWSETYDTTFSANDFSGGTRTVKAQEGAMRENLKALVEGLRERLPAP